LQIHNFREREARLTRIEAASCDTNLAEYPAPSCEQ
jgi:hypothetical protein